MAGIKLPSKYLLVVIDSDFKLQLEFLNLTPQQIEKLEAWAERSNKTLPQAFVDFFRSGLKLFNPKSGIF